MKKPRSDSTLQIPMSDQDETKARRRPGIWRGGRKEYIRKRSSTDDQRSQTPGPQVHEPYLERSSEHTSQNTNKPNSPNGCSLARLCKLDAMLKSRDRDIAEAKFDLQRRKSKLLESQAREKAKKNAPPEPPLTQEERMAIIADMDDILGIKRRTPHPTVAPQTSPTQQSEPRAYQPAPKSPRFGGSIPRNST